VVDALVILDGAAQPVRPTALERARTPVLDALAAGGAVARVATTPPGLPPGSETCIPTLLGCAPVVPVGRGRVEAAAHGIEVPDGVIPWRGDVLHADGRRACARAVAASLPGAVALGGHRLLLLAARRPEDSVIGGLHVRVWDDGPPPSGRVGPETTLVCARGAAAGCGRLLGARVVVPAGATGDVDTDLRAKAAAAIAADPARVVVHVGAPDEAAHRRDPDAVIDALERIDAELLAPLREAAERLAVCPDHGTDPLTGRHDGAPGPAVRWGAGVAREGPERMHERAVAAVPVVDPGWLFAREAVAA